MAEETKKVLFLLLDEYTDWEGAFLSTALHVGVVPGGEIKYRGYTVAPTLNAVCSIGGLVATVGIPPKQNLLHHW